MIKRMPQRFWAAILATAVGLRPTRVNKIVCRSVAPQHEDVAALLQKRTLLRQQKAFAEADELLDADVYDSNGEEIGEVEDILLGNDMSVHSLVIKPGDVLEVDIEGIGVLQNQIIDEVVGN